MPTYPLLPPHVTAPHPPFPLLAPPLPLPCSLPTPWAPHAHIHLHSMYPPAPGVLKNHPSPLPFFLSLRSAYLHCLSAPSSPWHTYTPTPSVCNFANRRRRGSSGRPGMIFLRLKGRMRKIGGMKGWRKKTTITLNSAGCARMEGSCYAVTPAPPPTTYTVSTLLSPKSLMENGSVPAARWVLSTGPYETACACAHVGVPGDADSFLCTPTGF